MSVQVQFFISKLLSICLLIISFYANADSQQISDYVYDGAGNIISINTVQNTGPPVITSLSPGFINRDNISSFIVFGINLKRAEVSTTTQGLTVLNVSETSENEVRFSLSASNDAPIGSGVITVANRLGSDSTPIVVANRVPVIATSPSPIALEPNGQMKQVSLLFDQAFASDQVFDVSISDTDIATVAQTSVTLLAGEREVSVDIAGVLTGNTTLNINQLSNFLAVGVLVVVTDPFPLPSGINSFASKPLGINLTRYDAPSTVSAVTKATTGVRVNRYVAPATASAITNNVTGVRVNRYLPPSTISAITNAGTGVRVTRYSSPTTNFSLSQDLGVTYTPVAENVSPAQVLINSSSTLLIDGESLNLVTSVSIQTNDGTILNPIFTVNPAGTQIDILFDTTGLSPGLAKVILTTASSGVPFSEPLGEIIEITN